MRHRNYRVCHVNECGVFSIRLAPATSDAAAHRVSDNVYDRIGAEDQVYQEVISSDANYDVINPDHVALPLPPPRGISVNSADGSDSSVVSHSRMVSVIVVTRQRL